MNTKKFNTFLSVVGLTLVVITTILLTNRTNSPDLAPITPTTKAIPAVAPEVNPNNLTQLHQNKASSPKTVTSLKLKNSRVLLLFGEVNGTVSELVDEIKELGQQSKEPIYLLINSPGGSVLDGALVISAIESSPAPVYTVCTQLCASMAAMIHQYGHKRMMVDRSILMFHDAAGGLQGYVHHMLSRLNQIHAFVHKMDRYVSNRAGIDFERYLQEANRELWLDAEDATNLKLNDEIVNIIIPRKTKDRLNSTLEKEGNTDKTKSNGFVWK